MSVFLAFAETRAGGLRKVAFEAVTAARQAADSTGGGEVHAVLLGAPGLAQQARALGRNGADVVYVVEHSDLERYNPEVYSTTVSERIGSGQYRAAFFTASADGAGGSGLISGQPSPPVGSRFGVFGQRSSESGTRSPSVSPRP